MHKTRRTLGGITVMITVLALLAPGPAIADSRCYRHGPGEKRMVRKINRARVSAGVGRLDRDPELSRVASAHTRTMAENNRLFHTPSELLGRRVTRWNRLGENVAYGQAVGGIHRMFMRSAPHKANILGSYRHVGVAISRGHGQRWVTVLFESRRNPGTRMDMPTC